MNVALVESIASRGVLSAVNRCGLGIIRREFLDALGQKLTNRCFYLGKLYNPEGASIKDWRTYRGKHRVVVRGIGQKKWRGIKALPIAIAPSPLAGVTTL